MKKTAGLCMGLVVLILLVCGCAPKTVEEACRKADAQVEEWNEKSWHICSYSSEYIENINGSTTDVYAVYVIDLTYSDMTDFAKDYAQTSNSAAVYQELKEVFEVFGVSIAVMYYDEFENLVYVTIDGMEA